MDCWNTIFLRNSMIQTVKKKWTSRTYVHSIDDRANIGGSIYSALSLYRSFYPIAFTRWFEVDGSWSTMLVTFSSIISIFVWNYIDISLNFVSLVLYRSSFLRFRNTYDRRWNIVFATKKIYIYITVLTVLLSFWHFYSTLIEAIKKLLENE